MEVKKSPKADLENKRMLFFEIGLIVAIGLSLLAFSWATTDEGDDESMEVQEFAVEQEIIPITHQEDINMPPPTAIAPSAPVTSNTDFQIVNNDEKVSDKLDITTEDDQSKSVDLSLLQNAREEETVAEAKVFFIVEEMPTFRGQGQDGFRTYIAQNTIYPPSAIINRIQGTVYVQFIVEDDGRITNIKLMHSVDPLLDKEAVRVISSAPRWTPGRQRNKPVRVSFTFPIVFQL